MVECIEEHPDQTALKLLAEFEDRYPGGYSQRQLHTLQKRVRVWSRAALARRRALTKRELGERMMTAWGPKPISEQTRRLWRLPELEWCREQQL